MITAINRIDERHTDQHERKLQSIYVCHVRLNSTLVTTKINNKKTKTIKHPRRDLMQDYWDRFNKLCHTWNWEEESNTKYVSIQNIILSMTKCKNIRDCKCFLKLVSVSLKTRKNKAGRIRSKSLLKSLRPGIFPALNVKLD